MEYNAETREFIRQHQHDDVRTLALRAKKYPAVDMPAALIQIAGRQSAAHKIPSWHAHDRLIYPAHLSLEQCSSEITALYKASLLKGESLVDLTGGFGVDCGFMATGFREVTYVERQPTLCNIAKHNFPLMNLDHIHVANSEAGEYLNEMQLVSCIFIDPARRNEHGRKTVLLSDCEPDVSALESLLLSKADRVMIKLSPMLDISQALRDLTHTAEVHILSVQNECKELLLILNNEVHTHIPVHCINFTSGQRQEFVFTRQQEQEAECPYTATLGSYLYEPNASLLKGGAYRSVASAFGLLKLHPNSHLYTSDEYIAGFPGRIFRIESTFSPKDKQAIRQMAKANISMRNYPLSVQELRRQLKLKDGGDVYIFATTLMDHSKVLIKCSKA